VTEIRRATIKSYDAATHKADVQIAGSLSVWLEGVRVATNIPAGDVQAGRQCIVLFLDPSNQDEAVVATIQGALPSGGGGAALDGLPPPGDDAGAAGTASTASRSNHRHECEVAPPGAYPGSIWTKPGWYGQAGAAPGIGAGLLIFEPIYVARATTYDRIGVSFGSSLGNPTIRLGLYNYADGLPTSLILDAGTIYVTTPGLKSIVIDQTLQPGYYYLAWVADTTAFVITFTTTSPVRPPVAGFNLTTAAIPGWVTLSVSGRSGDVAGGLPDPAPTITGYGGVDSACVGLRNTT
jgi:hypothetical protein